MTMKSRVGLLAVALVFGLASGLAMAQEAGPTIEHTPVTQAQAGQPLTLTATIHSGNGVFQPVVNFRSEGGATWSKVPLLPSSGGAYSATLPGANLTGNIEYYVEAYDNDGNGPARAGSPETPYRVVVASTSSEGKARHVTAQTATGGTPPPGELAAEKKSGGMGKTVGGIVGLAVGAAGLGVGIYGWVERNQEVSYSNAADPSARFAYQAPITNFLVLGIVGTSVGVAAAGVGAWLLWSGLSSGSGPSSEPGSPASPASPASKTEGGGFSLAPVPGGAVAGYSGRF
jgi:hypothetical protein